jgi:hypothetical protein
MSGFAMTTSFGRGTDAAYQPLPAPFVGALDTTGHAGRMARRIIIALAIAAGSAHADPGWLTLGVTSEAQRYDATRGVRGEADLFDRDGWTMGVALAFAEGDVGVYDNAMTAVLATRDLKALMYVARTVAFERWSLRVSLGAGAIRTSASGDLMDLGASTPVAQTGLFGTFETSARAIVPISSRWAVTGGVVASYYGQTFELTGGTADGATSRLGDVQLLLGLSTRLF